MDTTTNGTKTNGQVKVEAPTEVKVERNADVEARDRKVWNTRERAEANARIVAEAKEIGALTREGMDPSFTPEEAKRHIAKAQARLIWARLNGK